jgi:hypothetical protein
VIDCNFRTKFLVRYYGFVIAGLGSFFLNKSFNAFFFLIMTFQFERDSLKLWHNADDLKYSSGIEDTE